MDAYQLGFMSAVVPTILKVAGKFEPSPLVAKRLQAITHAARSAPPRGAVPPTAINRAVRPLRPEVNAPEPQIPRIKAPPKSPAFELGAASGASSGMSGGGSGGAPGAGAPSGAVPPSPAGGSGTPAMATPQGGTGNTAGGLLPPDAKPAHPEGLIGALTEGIGNTTARAGDYMFGQGTGEKMLGNKGPGHLGATIGGLGLGALAGNYMTQPPTPQDLMMAQTGYPGYGLGY